jgi:hypothetical protein
VCNACSNLLFFAFFSVARHPVAFLLYPHILLCPYALTPPLPHMSTRLPLQVRAAQFYLLGQLQGTLRMLPGSQPGQSSATAHTYAAVLLTTLRWLSDLR